MLTRMMPGCCFFDDAVIEPFKRGQSFSNEAFPMSRLIISTGSSTNGWKVTCLSCKFWCISQSEGQLMKDFRRSIWNLNPLDSIYQGSSVSRYSPRKILYKQAIAFISFFRWSDSALSPYNKERTLQLRGVCLIAVSISDELNVISGQQGHELRWFSQTSASSFWWVSKYLETFAGCDLKWGIYFFVHVYLNGEKPMAWDKYCSTLQDFHPDPVPISSSF